MIDAISDKEKRSRGVLWYVGWGMAMYILSFPAAVQIIFYIHLRHSLRESTVTWAVWMFYWPAWKLFEAIGILGPLFDVMDRIAKWLP